MAIIYSYPQFAPKPEDLLIGTVTLDENAVVPIYDNPTVSFTIQSLLDMIAPITGAQNLQQVTNIGATTTNAITFSSDISVTGRFFDSSGSPGLAGQVLSSTVTGTSWIVNSPASVTSVGLSMPAAFSVANSPITTAGTLAVTGAGTALQYINGLGNLVTFPTIPTQYVLPLAANGTRGGIQIGYASAGKNYAVQLSSEKAFVNVPWTDTPYTLPVATSSDLGGVKIGYTDNAKNYAVELDSDKMYVNVPWTDTPYVLPLAADGTRGGVQIGYTQTATRDYPVTLDSEKMLVTVPWTDTQNPNQTLLGTGSDNSNSGIILNESGGTVLILGDGSVTAAQTSNTITLTGVNTWVANAVTVAGYVAAPAATDANLVWKTNAGGEPAWRADADTDTGITGVTLAINSTGTWTVPLSESITGRELTLTSNVYGGGAKVGYVPTGGTSDLYLKGDGTWAAVPTGLQFKGTWDASATGGGNPDLDVAANQGDGFLWITNVAGSATPNGAGTTPNSWAVGDWAVYSGTAGSGTWTKVPATNTGVTSLTTTDGTWIDLTPTTATTGAVTVTADLSAQDGSSDTSTKFLSKDNTWDVPSYTTNTDETYDLNAGAKVGTSVPINLTSTSGTDDSLVNLKQGTNITLTRGSATEITIDATDTNTNTTYDFLAIETIPTFTLNTPTTNTGYTTAVNLATTVSPAGGTGMTVDITASGGNVTAVVINKPGSGYAIGDAVTVVQTGSSANAIITLSGATGNVNPNLRLIDNAFAFEDVKLTGAGATTITRTSDTGITITSTDTNTQYTAGNGLNLSGTAFSADVNNTQANSVTTALSATAGRFYAVQLDNTTDIADAKLVVNVPWVDTDTTYSAMTTSTLGLGKIRYDIGLTPAAEDQSVVASRTYGVTKNASDQLVVNVPWSSGGTYSWIVRDNAGTPVDKTLSSGQFLQFKTATGALATGLTGSGTTGSPYIMTLTSPNDNTTYSNFVGPTGSGGAQDGTAGLVPAPSHTTYNGGYFLRQDATWVVPPDTTYSNFSGATQLAAGASGLVPAPAATYQNKFLQGNGGWGTPPNTEYSNFVSSTAGAAGTAGLVPAPAAATQGGTYYLNGDGSFSIPSTGPNDNTTYSIDIPSATTNINLKAANPSSNDAVAMTPGSGISITRNSSSQLTFANTAQDTGLPAIKAIADGTLSFGNANVTAATVRAKIEAQGYNTILVTVSNASGSNKYYLDGVLQADAILKPGFTYRFDQSDSTNSSHPLKFSITSDGTHNSGVAYTDGVTISTPTPGNAGSYTQIITTQATPYLYYYCTQHSGMGGAIPLTFKSLTTTGTSGASTLTNGVLNVPNYADTWIANSKTVAGYVAAPGAVANKVWKTDASGNPAWRADSDGGVSSFTNADGTFISAGTVNTAATGAVTMGTIDLSATGTASSSTFLRGDNAWATPGTGPNYYLDGITKAGNVLTFSVSGTTNQTYTFGSNAFNSTTIPTNNNQITNGAGYITSYTETDTLADVTGRGATTSTACSFTNTTSFLIGGSGSANLYLGNIIDPSSASKGARFHSNNNDFYFDFQGDATQNWFLRDYDGSGGIFTRFGFNFINGTFTAGGDVVAYGSPSDKRLKENIKPIESALHKAMKLQGVTFDWKENDSALDLKEDIGFIAQDVQKVLPELVRENKDGMLSMRHQGIAPILLEAIKELKAEIEELKSNKCNCNK